MMRKTVKIGKWIHTKSDIDRLSSLGVYKIWHTSDPNKIYIGETAYVDDTQSRHRGFYTRWNKHINDLELKKHTLPKLQKIVNQKGIEGIRFSIIEICNSKEESYSREGYYIDSLNPFYNKPLLAVFQFDMDGNFIRKYRNCTTAAVMTGIDRGSIQNSALKNRYSAGGYIWSFKETLKLKSQRVVQQFCMDGGLIKEFKTLNEAAKEMRTSSSTSIRMAAIGKQYQAYGYKWKIRWT